jgi:transcriptional regulator with XRE-family HTH domain
LPSGKPPSARSRQLAAELRRLRETSGLTGEEVASRLSWSASKVSRIETSRSTVTLGDLRHLLDLYQVPGSVRDRLTELSRTADQRGWWDAYSDTLSHDSTTFFALENDAEAEQFYGQMLLPGILQTSRYAEALIRAGLLAAPPGAVARRVEARMMRQRLLTREGPLQLSVILDEAALRRQVGGRDVMIEQISHLIEIAEQPSVAVQIIPFSEGAHIAMTGTFSLLRFAGPTPSYMVYLEHFTDELFIENEAEAFHYSMAFDRLSELSLRPEESVAFAEKIARELT